MKKIEAIIRPEKLGAVKHALEEIGVHALTAYEVQGRGEQKGLEFTHRAGKFRVDMLPKTKLEVVVKEGKLEEAVNAICSMARTGEVGDGKIFIIPVERVIKVRTGEVEP
ncbi:MAG TPA: P-II family nitrogen regulator [Methanomassiliicoccales archaeon]|nr:P-II family nitrogen regulator [Methanomassiliicoccales archaeon]